MGPGTDAQPANDNEHNEMNAIALRIFTFFPSGHPYHQYFSARLFSLILSAFPTRHKKLTLTINFQFHVAIK